jgi:hypothetical protein
MAKENVVSMHSEVLFSHKEEINYFICRKMDGIRDHYFEQISQIDKDKYHMFSFI